MSNFTLKTFLNKDYCKVCIKYNGLTRNNFPKAIHFDYDKDCLLFIVMRLDKPRIISHFFSLPQQQYLQDPSSIDKTFLDLFKGGGKSLLCWMLKELIRLGIINLNDEIELEAGGDEVNDEQIIRLIDYYKNLGFSAIDENQEVTHGYPMISNVRKLLSTCNSNSKISEFLKTSILV